MPIQNGKYVNPGWQNGGPPAIDANELNAISDTLENLDENPGTTYTPGNGISIAGQTISAKISSNSNNSATFGTDGGIYVQSPTYTPGSGISISGKQISAKISVNNNNAATFGTDGGIYVPESSYTLPIATSSQLGGIKVGEGLSISPDGTLSAGGSGSFPFYDYSINGNFNGQTSVSVGSLTTTEVLGRSFIAVYAMLSNSGGSSNITMSCSFGGYPVIASNEMRPGSVNRNTVALYYKAYQQSPGYYVVGVDGFYGGGFTFTSSTGQGSYALHFVAFGPNIRNS